MGRWRWSGILLFSAAAGLGVSTTAQAQSCVPECRDGFACIDGECVSACNPPCNEGERCSGDGFCVADTSPAAAAAASSDGNQDLRDANRLHVIFRIGAGGVVERFNGVGQTDDALATVGLTLRFEAPVHKVLTTGFAWSLYTFGGANSDSRSLGMDLSPFLKGRYAFSMGQKNIEAEAYGLFQFGIALAHVPDNDPIGYSTFGYGFNTAITPGFLIWPSDKVGTFFEVGYGYTWGRFDGELTGTLGQAVIRFGVAFAFY